MLDNTSIEVISKLKQALLRHSHEQEQHEGGDHTYLPTSNRGYKLNNPFLSLDSLHPKVVEYDGVQHLVLSNDVIETDNTRNKRKWNQQYYRDEGEEDEDKQEGEDDDDDDDEADQDEDDDEYDSDEYEQHPLKKLRINEILAPLNHPSEIITHPAISRTFKSTIFNKLASELIELIEIEQANLNWLNKLLQVLNGEDWFYLLEENIGLPDYDHGLDVDGSSSANTTKEITTNPVAGPEPTTSDAAPESASASAPEPAPRPASENGQVKQETEKQNEPQEQANEESDDDSVTDPFFALPQALKRYQQFQSRQLEPNAPQDKNELLKDDLINYLQVSIQRQHEYIKNLTNLRNGIVRADRLKRDLLKWGKEMHDKKSS
ncbi:uncharacterized protein SPAPADRAFT_62612 [Spathaspora passalidarum NRRL Y-27907]|uniref:Transcriptional regulatory protein RXT2 N-terminal domain-containing protein n=1 Tax=Spathaspora passalidarum (strain NRRL Y-27907 / 11-Y1) TaxID=619300 RepID=G3ASX8_SPAPN|nr:uncharacterized protein SPAPADRAFT_62612 [Spathaspora passalidarum NRRL Y-27907]EGW30760.1 hypothetical protein SPAPADRAFT_62612 [Spathaspora passalidarum NRRL Y-27907]